MIRGLDSKQEQSARQLARDTRPLGTRVAETIARPEVMLLVFGTCIGVTFPYPMVTDVLFVICTCLFLFSITRKTTLPFRIPQSAHLKDYNDPLPGSNKPRIGEGIFFLGNDRLTKEELWFSNDDMRTHVLIFGSTGSGKTEALVSMAFNSLLFASGFIYIDGKGDNSLFAKVFSMVRSMGRDDDMLLINFMTGARDVLGPQKTRLSNTMNPFSRGSSSMLSQLVVSLMSSGKGGGDDMWTNRAINFVESLMKVLAAMRDAGHILLDANSIRGYFLLEKLEQIVIDRRFPISDTYSVSLDLFPKQILEPLNAYMDNLPGYNRQKKGNQASEVREQHGFITMQLTRVFGSLADAYGHIIRTNLAEVDFKDVVLNRRVMVVLLPALEKSPQELSNLGKIIVASLKAMMAAGLGDEVEGDYRDVVLRKPTTALSPFLTIMDEYGYYAVEGFAVVPAQARSLGFAAIFAGQDLPAFQKASKEEAASIGANCNIKICMKLEDPQETWEFFNKVAGESYTTNVSGFQMDSSSLTMNYMDTRSASVDKRQRIDLLDLKDQRPGQFHVFFKSKIIRAETFFAAPKPVKKMRLNQFLKVEAPTEAQLIDMDKRFKRFSQVFATPHYEFPEQPESSDIKILVQSFQGAINLKPFERGIAALISLLEEEVQKQRDLSVPFENPGMEGEMSAFTKIFVTPMVQRMIGAENEEMFSLPLIRRGSTTEELIHIERLSGKSEQDAVTLANSMIEDIASATKFPPVIQFKTEPDQILQDISDIIVMFGGTPLDIAALKANMGSEPLAEATEELQETSEDTSDVAEISESEIPEFPELPDLEELFEEMPVSGDESENTDAAKEDEEDEETQEEPEGHEDTEDKTTDQDEEKGEDTSTKE
jgi:intracellular multiplication protein IcmO